jgi:hypothetical protein
MYGRAVALIGLFVLTSGSSALAQPTPLPTVTANSESWYLNGEPLLHDGNVYYPRGAAVYFDRDEFVRSGFYRGIPLYSRTTIEPFSLVYLPLAGGLMQPYVRPRTGELVGTIGSLSPSLPTPASTDERRYRGMAQAAGPPTSLPGPTDIEGNPRLVAVPTAVVAETPRPVGTSGTATASVGTVATTGRPVVLPRPRPLVTAARPTGVNGLFIEYDNIRWFVNGPTVEFDAAAFRRIGDYGEFPVFVRAGDDRAIYIPTGTNIRGVVARYARR